MNMIPHMMTFSRAIHLSAILMLMSIPLMAQRPALDVQGHRGCRGLMPENTIAAMIHALDLGVTTLEMDAVITADKRVILSHEPFMSAEISTRPDGSTISARDERSFNIYQMKLAEVRQWDVGLKPNARFPRQQRMKAVKPLLEDVIDSVETYIRKKGLPKVNYNIETKCDPSTDGIFHPDPVTFTSLLLDVIKRKGIAGRVIVQSFDIRTLQELHRKDPGIRTSMLVGGKVLLSVEENLKLLGFIPSIYSPYFAQVNEQMMAACREKRMQVVPWTVNDKASIEKMVALGVDGIITDYPDLFTR